MTESSAQHSSINLSAQEFRRLGHQLIDDLADFFDRLPTGPITPGESPTQVRQLLGDSALPESGAEAGEILKEATELLTRHSLFNGHPLFMGYITSSPSPLGALGELLAACINPNVGAWILSPVASEIESQTVRWIAEMIGCSSEAGGLLVSGGNQANFVAFLAARTAQAPWDVPKEGWASKNSQPMRVYASVETHTWIEKAMNMFGMGMSSLCSIGLDDQQRLDVDELDKRMRADLEQGIKPMMAIGTAGSVATGHIDPLGTMGQICRDHDCWFHIDGAYGAFAAVLEDAPTELQHLGRADSLALDPHKWLYSPIEAGCTLVRNPEHLRATFQYRPSYYKFEGVAGEHGISYNEYGPQNSRGFRALKVWLALKQMGRRGYAERIGENIALARQLFEVAQAHPELEVYSHSLSITTFRYRPSSLDSNQGNMTKYLDELNSELLTSIQESGELFLSNAIIEGHYWLRACIVNFRTSSDHIDAIPEIVVRLGRDCDSRMRPSGL